MSPVPLWIARLWALLLRRKEPHGRLPGTIVAPSQGAAMKETNRNTRATQDNMVCREKTAESEREREHREKVRQVSERIRSENREILDRLATK